MLFYPDDVNGINTQTVAIEAVSVLLLPVWSAVSLVAPEGLSMHATYAMVSEQTDPAIAPKYTFYHAVRTSFHTTFSLDTVWLTVWKRLGVDEIVTQLRFGMFGKGYSHMGTTGHSDWVEEHVDWATERLEDLVMTHRTLSR